MEYERSGDIIKKEIGRKGRVTFAEYMDMALYHPSEGYYMKDREKIGAAGDFYTSSDVSPIFGYTLADQMEEMWRFSGSPDEWTLMEFGAGKGNLARDILGHAGAKYPDFYKSLCYTILEKSPSMARRQKTVLSGILAPGGGIRWLGGPEEILAGTVNGCFFSNELVDAFPVHRVVRMGGEFREIYVTLERGNLVEVAGDLSQKDLSDYISDFKIDMEDGQIIEINLAMRDWLEKTAGALDRGFLLTIDYGDIAGRLYLPMRNHGTIRSYCRHQLMDNLYEKPGDQDITSHVNFTALIRWGEEAGLKTAGYTAQMYFLMNLGILKYLTPPAPGEKGDLSLMKETMAVKKLVMPEGMGSVFKVAVQQKGFDKDPVLTGFSGQFGSRERSWI